MQLVEREEIDEDDELFEAIDKRKIEIDSPLSEFACVVIAVIRIFDLCSLRSNLHVDVWDWISHRFKYLV